MPILRNVDLSRVPEWMQVPGIQFTDPGGDLCIVLGTGGWRCPEILGNISLIKPDVHEILYTLEFMPTTLVYCYYYKREWHLFDLLDKEHTADWFKQCVKVGG
jgi:hypothetical protein